MSSKDNKTQRMSTSPFENIVHLKSIQKNNARHADFISGILGHSQPQDGANVIDKS